MINFDSIEEIKRIEAEINKLTFIKANVSERINQTQKNIKKLNEEISSIEKEAKSLEEKNKLKETISEEIKELDFLEKFKLEIEESLVKIASLIVSNQNQVKISQELKKKVSSINFCPNSLTFSELFMTPALILFTTIW